MLDCREKQDPNEMATNTVAYKVGEESEMMENKIIRWNSDIGWELDLCQ